MLPGKIGGALVSRFGRETAEQIAKRALEKPVADGVLKRTAKGTVAGMATEGLTEAFNVVAKAVNDSSDALKDQLGGGFQPTLAGHADVKKQHVEIGRAHV